MKTIKLSSIAAAVNYSIPLLWLLGHTTLGLVVAALSLGLYAAVCYKTVQTVQFK